MFIFEKSFQFDIPIDTNLFSFCSNIEENIKNYINSKFINKNINDIILLEILSIKYLYPYIIPNTITKSSKYNLEAEVVFKCAKLFENMLIKDFNVNNSKLLNIPKLEIYSKKINNIEICLAYKIKEDEKVDNTKDFLQINLIDVKNNIINCIVSKFDIESTIENYISLSDKNIENNPLINIINNNINGKYKFDVNNIKITYHEYIKLLLSYKNTTTLKININYKLRKIVIQKSNNLLVPDVLIDQYISNMLINVYNLYIISL